MSFSQIMAMYGTMLKIIIPFLVLGLLVRSIDLIPKWIMDYRAKVAGFNKVDNMDGRAFEIWLAHQFSLAGYGVKRTPYQGDHGADLIVNAPNGKKIAIQAKQCSKRYARIGAKALGEVLRGKEYYGCDEAMMVTNQEYTRQAKEEAQRIGIKLMDRKELIDLVTLRRG